MILNVTFRGANKITAIKFLRIVGKIGLKEAKELIETLATAPDAFDIDGVLRLQVDPAWALSRLLDDRHIMTQLSMDSPYITVTTEVAPKLVDLSK